MRYNVRGHEEGHAKVTRVGRHGAAKRGRNGFKPKTTSKNTISCSPELKLSSSAVYAESTSGSVASGGGGTSTGSAAHAATPAPSLPRRRLCLIGLVGLVGFFDFWRGLCFPFPGGAAALTVESTPGLSCTALLPVGANAVLSLPTTSSGVVIPYSSAMSAELRAVSSSLPRPRPVR